MPSSVNPQARLKRVARLPKVNPLATQGRECYDPLTHRGLGGRSLSLATYFGNARNGS